MGSNIARSYTDIRTKNGTLPILSQVMFLLCWFGDVPASVVSLFLFFLLLLLLLFSLWIWLPQHKQLKFQP